MPSSIDKLSSLNKMLSTAEKGDATKGSDDFSKILQQSIAEINNTQVKGDRAMADIATGEVKDLHQAAIAINKAETSMKLMLEIRNKALSAYKEISKTQI
jgi:flagellar hook-basal body complex protein FliE